MFKNKNVLIFNILFAILIIIFDILYIVFQNQPYIFKTIASVLFVMCGIGNFIFIFRQQQRSNLFKYFMLSGLVFACLGDIFLIDFFIVGAILFAIGHIFFFIAYSMLYKINWRDILISLIIFGIALIVILVPTIFDFGNMLVIVLVYAFIISFMLGKSISNIFEKDFKIENLIIFVGSLMFFLSDLMLLFNVFANVSRIFGIICLVFYYPAEFLLAGSIYYSNDIG